MVSSAVFLAHSGKAQLLARKTREYAKNRETRTFDNRDDGKIHGIACSEDVPNDVTSLRTAVRIHTRISIVSGV